MNKGKIFLTLILIATFLAGSTLRGHASSLKKAGQPPGVPPPDERRYLSTTGPTPPDAVLQRDRAKRPDTPEMIASEKTLSVPSYLWRHGCGPTALGMVVGYYDANGYPDLIAGSPWSQTNDVNQAIASGGDLSNPNPPGSERHLEDYGLPVDGSSVTTDDYITKGRAPHASDSLADFMHTSRSTDYLKYGWSYSSAVGPAWLDYVRSKNPVYSPGFHEHYFSETLSWALLTTEIDQGRPMVFLVDSDGNGSTDHFITIIGYRTSPTNQYGAWDTWSNTQVRWENFAQISNGVPWGIMVGYSFQMNVPPAAFDKSSPADGSTGVSANPILTWEAASPASAYEYCYDTTDDQSCSSWTSSGLDTSAGLTGLAAATTYYWQVRAYNGSTGPTYAGGSADFWSFTTSPGPGNVIMGLSPASSSVVGGQAFEVTIQVQAGSQPVDNAAAYLNFNPAYLQVVALEGGAALPTLLQNSFDNQAGRINYAASASANLPSGDFTLATVTFQALAATGATPIVFSTAAPRQSGVSLGGVSVLGHLSNSSVTIRAGATLAGQVILQGRPAPPHASWSVPLTVTLTNPGDYWPTYTFTTTTGSSGNFTLGGILPATYEVRVKNSHTLANLKTAALAVGANSLDFGVLVEGDANDDNLVSEPDYSILFNSYGKCQGARGYDARADFNADACVTLLDFSWLSSNYGKAGDQPAVQPRLDSAAPGAVTMTVDPRLSQVLQGESFTIFVQMQAGSQEINAAQVSLDFDPALLKLKAIYGNMDPLPRVIQNTFDNHAGTLNYAAGAFSSFPQGSFTLATIVFEALQPVQVTSLAFHLASPRTSDAAWAGASVLAEITGGTVTIRSPQIFLPLISR